MSNDQVPCNVVDTPVVDVDSTGIEWTVSRTSRSKCTVRGTLSGITLTEEFNLQNDNKRNSAARMFAERLTERGFSVDAVLIRRELEDLAASLSDSTAMDEPLDPEALLTALGLMVLCSEKSGALLVYALTRRMLHEIPDIARLTYLRLIQIIGEQAAELVCEKNRTPTSVFTLEQVKTALASVSHDAPRRESLRVLGQGIHDVGDNTLLIVNGNELHYIDLSTMILETLETPIVGNNLIRFGEGAWCDGLPERFASMTPETIQGYFENLVIFIQGDRNWSHEWNPHIIAALIVATFIQDCLPWRPMVGLTGPTDSGKTILMQDKIFRLFGTLSLNFDNPTEAGLRQQLADSKLPVGIDEFDTCRQKHKILELLRSAGHGGTIVRGSQNHEAREFHIRHIIWLAGIHLGMFAEQDFNRFIRLNIPHLEVFSDVEAMSLTNNEIMELRHNIVTLALCIAQPVIQLIDSLADTPIDGVPHRMIQNFAVPAAVYAVATYGADVPLETAQEILYGMLAGRDMPEVLQTGTEQELLQDILFAKVPTGMGSEKFVHECIGDGCLRNRMGIDYSQELQKYGLKVVTHRGDTEPSLFIVPKLLTKYLLHNTPWAGMELEPILRQIEGVQRTQQRLQSVAASSGTTCSQIWGLSIPISSLPGNDNTITPNETR